MVVLLGILAAVGVTVTRGSGSGSIVSGLTGTSPAPPPETAPTSLAPTSTAPPSTTGPPPTGAPRQPLRPTPGNLLANGDFERDLGGWGPSGGGRVDRVPIGHSGGWSLRIRAGASAPPSTSEAQRPGMLEVQPVQGRAGRSYEASAWVRATRPGAEAIIELAEVGDGDSADVIGVTLPDEDWHQIAVIHRVQGGGRLRVEASASNLPPGGSLLLDQVSITAA